MVRSLCLGGNFHQAHPVTSLPPSFAVLSHSELALSASFELDRYHFLYRDNPFPLGAGQASVLYVILCAVGEPCD